MPKQGKNILKTNFRSESSSAANRHIHDSPGYSCHHFFSIVNGIGTSGIVADRVINNFLAEKQMIGLGKAQQIHARRYRGGDLIDVPDGILFVGPGIILVFVFKRDDDKITCIPAFCHPLPLLQIENFHM